MVKKNEIDLFKITQSLNSGKKTILYAVLLSFIFSIFYLILATPLYQSNISINPMGDNISSPNSIGGLEGLASEYGVNLNIGNFLNDKPSFYIPDIVNSRLLKKAIIRISKVLLWVKQFTMVILI